MTCFATVPEPVPVIPALGVFSCGSLSHRTVNKVADLEHISDTSADFVDWLLLHLTDLPNLTLRAASTFVSNLHARLGQGYLGILLVFDHT